MPRNDDNVAHELTVRELRHDQVRMETRYLKAAIAINRLWLACWKAGSVATCPSDNELAAIIQSIIEPSVIVAAIEINNVWLQRLSRFAPGSADHVFQRPTNREIADIIAAIIEKGRSRLADKPKSAAKKAGSSSTS